MSLYHVTSWAFQVSRGVDGAEPEASELPPAPRPGVLATEALRRSQTRPLLFTKESASRATHDQRVAARMAVARTGKKSSRRPRPPPAPPSPPSASPRSSPPTPPTPPSLPPVAANENGLEFVAAADAALATAPVARNEDQDELGFRP